MAYEVFANTHKAKAISNASLAVSIGLYSLTLNSMAFDKFADKTEVCLLWDKELSRAGIRFPDRKPSFANFRLMRSPKSNQARVVGCRRFLLLTGMLEMSRVTRVVECEWDEATDTLSWYIAKPA